MAEIEAVKAVYLLPCDEQVVLTRFPGVYNKINQQIDAMRSCGIACELLFLNTRFGTLGKVLKRIPFAPDGIEWSLVNKYPDLDVIYIRRVGYISKEMIRFLKKYKTSHPEVKVLLELPTYPYDGEYRNIKGYPMLRKDIAQRGKLKGVVDRVVDLSQQQEIFGIPTIRIINGIDLSAIRPRSPSPSSNGVINIVCVAAFQHWHGIDRLFSGMGSCSDLLKKRPVHIHMVGDGPALPSLRGQVVELGLEDCVTFHGQCNQSQMDEIYNRCSFAIASLALHRIGLNLASTLKTREYLAKGMPFLYSGNIDVFQDDPVDFCLKIPADESPVDIQDLINFNDEIYSRCPERALIREIRTYAESHLNMHSAIKNMTDYIKENCIHES